MSGFVRLPTPICTHAECPLWWPTTGTLYFSDIPNRQVHTWNPENGRHYLAWEGDSRVGGIAYQEGSGLILFGDKHIVLVRMDGRRVVSSQKLVSSDLEIGERFNDITTDSAGRVLAGTMADGKRVVDCFFTIRNAPGGTCCWTALGSAMA